MQVRSHRTPANGMLQPLALQNLRRLAARWGAPGVAMAVLGFAAYRVNSQVQTPNPDRPLILPQANRPPDANAQMQMREQSAARQNFVAPNQERKKQISDDSARLLKLATDLKAEVDKTTKDTLSLSVIRKADEIEKLAHNVKEKMKLTVGSGN